MGKVLNSKKESRRRVRRAVLKSLKVVTDRSDTVTDNQQEIVPMIPLQTDSNVNVDNSQTEDDDSNEGEIFNIDRSLTDESVDQNSNIGSDICQQSTKTTLDLRDQLKDWSVVFNITQRALSANLKIFKSLGHDLPSDARTLLNTPRKSKVFQCEDGTYYYAGIFRNLEIMMSKLNFDIGDTFYIDFNIDGLPLSRSSRSDLWPILGRIYNTKFKSDVFLIGAFHGTSKPNDLNLFFENFVREVLELYQGFNIGGKKYNIFIGKFICDSPATSFIKCIKQFNGYFGCGKCRQEGEGLVGKTIFPDIDCELRTDENFRQRVDYEHHLDTSPLEQVVGMVSQFVLDYMHLVCLGVMKKLIYLWQKGPFSCRLSAANIRKLSLEIMIICKQFPSDFNRKVRKIEDYHFWKATEFRNFLLYVGPVVLQNILPKKYYQHFLLFSAAITILINPSCENDIDIAELMLKKFVTSFALLYGVEHMVYNVHNLSHLAAEARANGRLDEFSAFPYENHLGKIKRIVRKNDRPMEQISNRNEERLDLIKVFPIVTKQPVPFGEILGTDDNDHFDTFWSGIGFQGGKIKTDSKNNAVLLNNNKSMIIDFVASKNNEMFVIGKLIKNTFPLYSVMGLTSHYLNISFGTVSVDMCVIPISMIKRKCLAFSHKKYICTIPLLHSLDELL